MCPNPSQRIPGSLDPVDLAEADLGHQSRELVDGPGVGRSDLVCELVDHLAVEEAGHHDRSVSGNTAQL